MPESIFNNVNNTNTILGLVNQLTAQMNASFSPLPETTINHKRNLYPVTLPQNLPTLKYFGVGNNGFYNINDSNLSQPYRPSEENMDLYHPIPFRCVPVDTDLTPEDRALYRIRTRETFAGQDYFCYWLKLISFPNPVIDVTRVNELTGEETPYVFDNTNLTPTPDPDSGVHELDEVTERVVVSSAGIVTVTGAEIAEAISVIYGGDFRYARISEYGFYTGEDQVVEALTGGGAPFDMTEAIYTQLATHRCSTGIDVSDPATVVTETVRYTNGSHYLI